MSSLLRVEHVTISYNGKPVVQDVNFELKQGEILGIVGESGSGKSTIIKAIMGLLGEEGLVTKGDIWYKGENLTDMSTKELRRYLGKEIGMVFQDCKSALCPVRKIGAQIYEAVSEHEKASRHEVRNRAGEIMKISCTLGMSCATLSIIPLFSLPGIVSPTAYFSRGLLARRMFMRTPPINSDTSSALLPLGIRSSVSNSTSTITFPGFT